MKREQAVEIACHHAAAEGRSYYGEGFVPHEWVVNAILEAADTGARAAVLNQTGFDPGPGAIDFGQ